MGEKRVRIPSIFCGHRGSVNLRLMTIKRELSDLEGVNSVEGDEKTKTVTISWDYPLTWEKIADTMKEIGYPAEA